MSSDFLNINISNLKLDHVHKYLFNERSTKFIYSDLKNKKINALSNLLVGKVVEVIHQRESGGVTMSFVKLDDEEIGWVNLETSIRLYRLPKIHGKFKDIKTLDIMKNDFNEEVTKLKNKLIKANYFFLIDEIPYLLVSKLGSEKHFPIRKKDFYQLVVPSSEIFLNLDAGTDLYKDSRFTIIENNIEENSEYKVASYFEGLTETRIIIKGKQYWVKMDHPLIEEEVPDKQLDSYEFIDMIIYLKEENERKESRLLNQRYKLQTIQENIEISNDLESLYLKKYIGESNEFK